MRFACRGHDRRLPNIFGGEGGLSPLETLHRMDARRRVLPLFQLPRSDSVYIDYSEFQLGHPSMLLAMHLHEASVYCATKLQHELSSPNVEVRLPALEFITALSWCGVSYLNLTAADVDGVEHQLHCSMPSGVGDTNGYITIIIINHPPVITMFMGGIDHQKWVGLLSGWWFGTCFIFPFSWEFHHPN